MDPDPYPNRDSLKMLDPDPMNPDPQHCQTVQLAVNILHLYSEKESEDDPEEPTIIFRIKKWHTQTRYH